MKTLRILLVDDSERVRNSMSELLKKVGCVVETAVDGEDAWTKFSSNPQAYDAVITDLQMPNLGGLELAERIKEVSPGTPILLQSSSILPELPPNIDLFIAKGVDFDLLYTFLDDIRGAPNNV